MPIGRKRGQFALSLSPSGQPTLVLGAPSAVRVPKGGFIVCLGLTVAQVTELRDRCNALLSVAPPG